MNRIGKQFLGIITFLAIIGSAWAVFGPPPAVDLDLQGGTWQTDSGRGIDFDAAGNIYLALNVGAAYQGQTGLGNTDVVVQKMSPDGTILWARQIGTSLYDSVGGVAVMADGTSMIVGHSQGVMAGETNAGFDDLIAVSFDANGVQLGQDQYGGSSSQYITDIATDGTHFYITGSTYLDIPGQTSAGGQDATVYKYDTSANLVESIQFGTSGADDAGSITVDPVAGRLYVAGFTSGSFTPSNGSNDGFIAVLDLNLNLLQTVNIGTADSDFFNGIGRDSAGNLYTAGRIFASGSASLWVSSYDSSLTQRWSRSFAPVAGSNYGFDIAVAGDGTSYTTGQFNQLPDHPYESQVKAGVLSLDANGVDRWSDQFGSIAGTTEGYAIGIDPSDRVTMVGRTQSDFVPGPNPGGYDYILRRYVAEGGTSNVIDDCAVIGTPGTWQLGQDLDCLGVALDVTADDVVLEMNGRTIRVGSDGSDAIAIRGIGVSDLTIQDSTGGARIEQWDQAVAPVGLYLDSAVRPRVSDVGVSMYGSDAVAAVMTNTTDAVIRDMIMEDLSPGGSVVDLSGSTGADLSNLTLSTAGGTNLGLQASFSSGASLTDVTIDGLPDGSDAGNGLFGTGVNLLTLNRVNVNNAGVDLEVEDLSAVQMFVQAVADNPERIVRLIGSGTVQNSLIRNSKVSLKGSPAGNLQVDGTTLQALEELIMEDHVKVISSDIDLSRNNRKLELIHTLPDSVILENTTLVRSIDRAPGLPLIDHPGGVPAQIRGLLTVRTAKTVNEIVGEMAVQVPTPVSLSRLEGENGHISERSAQLVDILGPGDRTFYNSQLAIAAELQVIANEVDVTALCTGTDSIATCPASTASIPAVYMFGQFTGVTECGILTGPGNFDVMNDLASAGGDCLRLQGDHVKLFGMNHRIMVSGGLEVAPAAAVRIEGDNALVTNLEFQLGTGFNIGARFEPNTEFGTIQDVTLWSAGSDDVGISAEATYLTTARRVTGSTSFQGWQFDYDDADALVIEDSTLEGNLRLNASYGLISRSVLDGDVIASSTPAEPALQFSDGRFGWRERVYTFGDNVLVRDSDLHLGRTGRIVNNATSQLTPVQLERARIYQYDMRPGALVENSGAAPDVEYDRLVLETTDETGVSLGVTRVVEPLGEFPSLSGDWDYTDRDSLEIGTELDGTSHLRFEYPARDTPVDPASISLHLSWDPNDPFDFGDCWPVSAAGAALVVECVRDFGTGQIVAGEVHLRICGDNVVNPQIPGDCEIPGTENCDADCNYIAPNPMVEIGKGGLPGELVLTWAGTGSSFTVYRSLNKDDVVGTGELLTTTTGLTYSDTPPDDGMDYFYEVVANP